MAKFTPPEETGAGFYITKDEKAGLVSNGTTLEVVTIEEREDTGDYPGTNYVVTVVLDDEERGLSFKQGSVQSRDRFLAELQAFLAQPDAEPVSIYIEKKGQAQLLRVAE